VSQSARGELVMGASLDPYEVQSTRSTLDFVEGLSAHMLDMLPFLSHAKVVRQWAGMADMTPDFAPIMGKTRSRASTSTPAGAPGASRPRRSPQDDGAHGRQRRAPSLITGFTLDRYQNYSLTGEKGAASVGH
jgi:sarcosine oxidase subunit beta